MKRNAFVKLITDSNKTIKKDELLETLGRRNNFKATDVGWVLDCLISEKKPKADTAKGDTLEFSELHSQMKNLAREKGKTYRSLDLLKLFSTPKFSGFVAKSSPLKLYKNVLAVSDLVLENLKEIG